MLIGAAADRGRGDAVDETIEVKADEDEPAPRCAEARSSKMGILRLKCSSSSNNN